MPKLEVFCPALGRPALYPEDPDVVAVASDAPCAPGARGLAWLDLNDPGQVLDWLRNWMRERPQVP